MVIMAPPRRRNQPGNKFTFISKVVATLIQDTFNYVRENVRLYNCEGFVTFVYFVFESL